MTVISTLPDSRPIQSIVSKFGLPLILISNYEAKPEDNANNNVLNLMPSQDSIAKAAISLLNPEADMNIIAYYDPTDIHPYLNFTSNFGNDRQLIYLNADNITLEPADYAASKSIVLSRCNRESGLKFLEDAMISGKQALKNYI